MRLIIADGTPAEVGEILRQFPELRAGIPSNGSDKSSLIAAAEAKGAPRYWTENAVRRLATLLWGDQKKLARLLMERGGVSYREVLKHLGFSKGQQLSGIRSGITRNAKKVTGFADAEFVQWRRRTDNDWEGEYYIHPDALRLLKDMGVQF